MRNFLKNNNRGFSLVETMVGVAIMGITVFAAMSFTSASSKIKKKSDVTASVYKYRSVIIDSLRSSDALAESGIASNALCLKSRQNCGTSSTDYRSMKVLDREGVRLTDNDSPNQGFGVDTKPCTTFPSEICPFRYEVEWRALCSGGASCQSPQLKARGIILMTPKMTSILNANNYAFEVTLGQIIGSYEQGCTSVGGSYVPGPTPACSIPLEGECLPTPDGIEQRVVGFDRSQAAGARKICRPIFATAFTTLACANGQVMRGTDANGVPVCRAIEMPTPVSGVVRPFECQTLNPPPSCNDSEIPFEVPPPSFGGDGGCGGGDGCA